MDSLAIANDEQRYNKKNYNSFWEDFYKCEYNWKPLRSCDICIIIHEQEKTDEKSCRYQYIENIWYINYLNTIHDRDLGQDIAMRITLE